MFSKRTHRKLTWPGILLGILLALAPAVFPCGTPPPNGKDNTTSGRCTLRGHPIVIAEGSVTENAVDASLPGRTFGWSHSRSYSSSLSGGTYIQGEKWKADWFTAFLAQGDYGVIELYMNNVTKRVFTYSGGSYLPSDDFLATLTHDISSRTFLLKLTDTGEQFTFYDFDGSWDAASRGMLKSRSDRYGQESIQYTYSAAMGGRITSVTTSQGWTVTYSYVASGVNIGRIDTIDVKNGSSQTLQRVKYTYFADGAGYSTGCGSNGDLIMVEVLTRSSADDLNQSGDTYFASKRITMYRYFRAGDTDGAAHQLKMVLSPAAVEKAMADGGNTPGQLLALADTGIVAGSTALSSYANITYKYYTSNFNTTDVLTTDGGVGGDHENLQDKYGGTDFDETGFVRSQTIRKDYRGFMGTRTYFYMNSHDPATSGLNAVTRILVEDTKDTGTRRIYGINKIRMLLREVFVDAPTAGTPKYWCKSLVRGDTKNTGTNNFNQVVEARMPSAHNGIDTLPKVRFFLGAQSDSDWANTDILNASTGVIHTYAYDASGFPVEEKIKKGRTGSEYYLRAIEYGDGTANKPNYLPVKEYSYPQAVTSKADASRLTTEYAYTFHDSSTVAQQLKTRTITYPTVTTDQNGSGVAATTSEYYDDRGRLRWTQDGEGHVNYYSYNANTGGLGYTMVDVKTNSLPSEITTGSSPDWIVWGGTVPFTHTDSGSLQLATKYAYDGLGRQVRVEDAEGMVTCTAYGDNQTRVYPGWNAGSHVCALPIRVVKTNDDDLAMDVYTVDPAGVTIGYSGSLPTGSDGGETQSDYVTWTHYAYNAVTVLLEKTDRYHSIPSAGTGTMGDNFHRTFYRYDSLGQRTHTIQVVSGTTTANGVEQVTQNVYDVLGRLTEVQRGVSTGTGTGDDMGSDYSSNMPTLKAVARNFYDESTPGSGTSAVGDGLTTSTLAYYDGNHVDADHAIKTVFHHNWRGQLRGIEPGAAPYTVRDVDNLGRVTAVAQYQGNVTWSTAVDDDDFAATIASDAGTSAKRGSLSRTYWDNAGRVYRGETYSVAADTGAAGDKLASDSYFDRSNRLVARCSPARGGVEYAYDGGSRPVETRVATGLASTKYDAQTGAFQYVNPQPGATTGGDNGVLRIVRTTYDKVGDPNRTIVMEANHNDTGAQTRGINLDASPKDYVQTFTCRWYEPLTHRLDTVAQYGTNDSEWKYASAPSYGTAPTASGESVLVSKYYYSQGRLEKVRDPKGLFVKYTYDATGRTVQAQELDASEAVKRTTLTQYDGLSNVTKAIADLGTADSMTNGAWTTDSNDQVTIYSYGDAQDATLTTRIQYPDGDAAYDNVKFTYNLDGTPATRTAQKTGTDTASVLNFDYDATFRRLEKQRVNPAGTGVDTTVQSIKYTYDSLARREKITSYSDNNATTPVNEVQFQYNGLGLLVKESQAHTAAAASTDPNTQYVFDATSGGYNGLTGVYNAGMRLTNVRYPNARRSFLTYGSGDANDALSRLAAIKDDDGTGGEGSVLASYSWNGLSRLVVESFVPPSVRLDYWRQPDATATAGTYKGLDRFGRIGTQAWRDYSAGALRERLAYGYDFNSNRTYRQNVLAGTANKYDELYAHDDLNRLLDFKRGNLNQGKTDIPYQNPADRVRREEWTLTDTGNWSAYKVDADGDGSYTGTGDLDQSRTHNAVNEIWSATAGAAITEGSGQSAWADPAHDARGNMTTVPKPGDMTATYTCIYDAWNRLVKVQTSGGSPTTVAEYRYDGLGRRIRKFTPDGANWTVRDFYYNAGWQLLEVRQAAGVQRTGSPLAEPAVATTVQEQYVWSARYIDSPVLRDRRIAGTGSLGKTGSGLDERLYYLTDAQQNVTAVVDGTPGSQTLGAVVERYVYDPYGRLTILNGAADHDSGVSDWSLDGDQLSDVDNPVLFAGYYRDPETGLCHVRNRMYHPLLGRWLQRDPIGYVDGMGMYQYCGSEAAGAWDPLGLAGAEGHHFVPKSVWKKIEGLSDEAIAAFDAATSGEVADGYNLYDQAHRDYNEAVKELWDDWSTENHILANEMTELEAKAFVNAVKTSKRCPIAKYLEHIAEGRSKHILEVMAMSLGRGARTAGKIGKGLGVIGNALGVIFFISDWAEGGVAHATLQLTPEGQVIEAGLDACGRMLDKPVIEDPDEYSAFKGSMVPIGDGREDIDESNPALYGASP